VEKGHLLVRSIASLQPVSQYPCARRFLARLASESFWTAWNQGLQTAL